MNQLKQAGCKSTTTSSSNRRHNDTLNNLAKYLAQSKKK